MCRDAMDTSTRPTVFPPHSLSFPVDSSSRHTLENATTKSERGHKRRTDRRSVYRSTHTEEGVLSNSVRWVSAQRATGPSGDRNNPMDGCCNSGRDGGGRRRYPWYMHLIERKGMVCLSTIKITGTGWRRDGTASR